MMCKYCKKQCTKKGKVNNLQRYRCNSCGRYQQRVYTKPRIPPRKYEWTVKLNNEGCGISSIARLLALSKSSVQRIIV